MKQFNKDIEIVISVDSIANNLLNTFPEDYKHRELLTEAIIGSSLATGKLSYIYNALAGYTNDINFEVGDKVICTSEDRREVEWQRNEEGSEKTKRNSRNVAIGECEVLEINEYEKYKLKVKFEQDSYYTEGKKETSEVWVDHRTCTKISVESKEAAQLMP